LNIQDYSEITPAANHFTTDIALSQRLLDSDVKEVVVRAERQKKGSKIMKMNEYIKEKSIAL
jgi:hypothetical protein